MIYDDIFGTVTIKVTNGPTFPEHDNCRCVWDPPREPEAMREAGQKFAAQCALLEHRITIPTNDEWVGLHLLERDDLLVRKAKS